MASYESVLQLIGGTPLLHLRRLEEAERLGGRVYAKLERNNPGGSAKDRVALAMLEEALCSGALRKGMPIVEPTSGNTGVGLAMVCAYLGFELLLTMPDSMSKERRDLLAAYGARLVLTPAEKGMQGAVDEANRLVKQRNGFCPSQFDNPANPAAHRATAEEIFEDLQGEVAALVACVGTGGTLCGSARALKARIPDLWTAAVEPAESPLLSGGQAGSHGIQGIGANFIPGNYDASVVDEVLCVSTEEAGAFCRRLAREEGLLCGISSGAAVCAALSLAGQERFAGKNIVCVLPDTGERYLSSGVF